MAIIIAGGDTFWFIDPASLMIVVGGTISALLVAFPIKKVMSMINLFKIALFPSSYNYEELIMDIISFSEKARREGLLALEDTIAEVDDPFMRKGLQLIVDGTDPSLVRGILEIEIEQMVIRHDANKRIFDDASTFSPAFGMIGTLMGLIMMLVNLSDKSKIGPYLAVALITTFYGAVLCYLVLSPLATKLDQMTQEEVLIKQIVIAGVLSVHSGENPRITKDKLVSFLPASVKDNISEKVGE
ncbi:MAG: motility protein A [Spirochaetes bacterium]|nr:motility protein A [Spirochaetota bacterium]